MRRPVAALIVVLGILMSTTRGFAAPGTIVFFDPDANHNAIIEIKTWFDAYLQRVAPGLQFQPVQNSAMLEKLVKDGTARYVIVSSAFLKQAAAGTFVPIMLPAKHGDVYYRKILVDRGTNPPGDLVGHSIAATLGTTDIATGSKRVLEELRQGGAKVERTRVIPVSKDIDALLALTFGQADAALVTPASLPVLARINPAAAASFRQVLNTAAIVRSPFCAVESTTTAAERQQMQEILKKMSADEDGARAMNTLGFDAWVLLESKIAEALR